MKETENEPVLLELAPLPREQVGPFLLLGLEKDADREQIEAHWARRVIWARRNQLRVALQDIHWAREVLSDPDRRARAGAGSLHGDTADGGERRPARRYPPRGPRRACGRRRSTGCAKRSSPCARRTTGSTSCSSSR